MDWLFHSLAGGVLLVLLVSRLYAFLAYVFMGVQTFIKLSCQDEFPKENTLYQISSGGGCGAASSPRYPLALLSSPTSFALRHRGTPTDRCVPVCSPRSVDRVMRPAGSVDPALPIRQVQFMTDTVFKLVMASKAPQIPSSVEGSSSPHECSSNGWDPSQTLKGMNE